MTHPSTHHVDQMADQGFTTLPDVFSPAEVVRMRAAVEEVSWRRSGVAGGAAT